MIILAIKLAPLNERVQDNIVTTKESKNMHWGNMSLVLLTVGVNRMSTSNARLFGRPSRRYATYQNYD